MFWPVLLLTAIAIATLLVTLALPTVTEADDAETEAADQLTALVEAWIDAEVEDDRGAVEEILHEDFLSTFASGTTLNRADYIDFIISLDIEPFSVTNEAIRVHGDTAVVIDVSDDGQTKFTWIAARQEGRWRVIAQTFSRME